MDSATYLAHLRREFGVFDACLAGDLSAPVEHGGGWALYDLADHLGQGNMWAAVGVTDKRGASLTRRWPPTGSPKSSTPMAPRQVRLGRTTAPRHAIRLHASDTGSAWAVLGPGEPVATLDATATDLLLLLWGRRSPDDRAITWDGDRRSAQATLSGTLVP